MVETRSDQPAGIHIALARLVPQWGCYQKKSQVLFTPFQQVTPQILRLDLQLEPPPLSFTMVEFEVMRSCQSGDVCGYCILCGVVWTISKLI